MTHRAPRPCAERGCSNLVYKGSRCDSHRLPRAVDGLPNSTARGYGYNWKIKVRDPYLALHPWCADPYGKHQGVLVHARIVDHKIPRRQGGTDIKSNLQGLCVNCHNYKTAIDGSKGGGRKNSKDVGL